MRLDTYLRDFERSVANLPGILERWETVPDDLRDHYSEELLLFLVRVHEASALAAQEDRALEVAQRLAVVRQTLASFSCQFPALGLEPSDFVPTVRH